MHLHRWLPAFALGSAIMLTGCSDGESAGSHEPQGRTADSQPSTRSTPTPSWSSPPKTPVASDLTTPLASSEPEEEEEPESRREYLIFTCSKKLSENSFVSGEIFGTLEEIWALDADEQHDCRIADPLSTTRQDIELPDTDGPMTQDEMDAVESGDGAWHGDDPDEDELVRRLHSLYDRCVDPEFKLFSAHEVEDAVMAPNARVIAGIRGAMTLCPDHPNIKSGEERVALGETAEKQRADGRRFRHGGRVGEEIQPGTYYIEGSIGTCYWETLDPAGNIIANNFVNDAQRVEAYISPDAYTFSSEWCDLEWAPAP